MSKIDTSAEAVERLAAALDAKHAEIVSGRIAIVQPANLSRDRVAATLRGLLARAQAAEADLRFERATTDQMREQLETLGDERDAARAERDAAKRLLDDLNRCHSDAVAALSAAVQERDAARAVVAEAERRGMERAAKKVEVHAAAMKRCSEETDVIQRIRAEYLAKAFALNTAADDIRAATGAAP